MSSVSVVKNTIETNQSILVSNVRNNFSRTDKEQLLQTHNITDSILKKLKNYRANYKGFQNIDYHNLNQHYIGKINVKCQHYAAKHFRAEKVYSKDNSFNDCSLLKSLPPLPNELQQLFSGNHQNPKNFYKICEVTIGHFLLHLLMLTWLISRHKDEDLIVSKFRVKFIIKSTLYYILL